MIDAHRIGDRLSDAIEFCDGFVDVGGREPFEACGWHVETDDLDVGVREVLVGGQFDGDRPQESVDHIGRAVNGD